MKQQSFLILLFSIGLQVALANVYIYPRHITLHSNTLQEELFTIQSRGTLDSLEYTLSLDRKDVPFELSLRSETSIRLQPREKKQISILFKPHKVSKETSYTFHIIADNGENRFTEAIEVALKPPKYYWLKIILGVATVLVLIFIALYRAVTNDKL